ncbi:MAG: hypothetical protein P8X57_11340, partial [Cyclobacteriaceae bacterium]
PKDLRYLEKPLPNMKISKKQAIMQSLDSMSPSETEDLLKFIRGLLYNPANDYRYLERKKEGMREIRRALEEAPVF